MFRKKKITLVVLKNGTKKEVDKFRNMWRKCMKDKNDIIFLNKSIEVHTIEVD